MRTEIWNRISCSAIIKRWIFHQMFYVIYYMLHTLLTRRNNLIRIRSLIHSNILMLLIQRSEDILYNVTSTCTLVTECHPIKCSYKNQSNLFLHVESKSHYPEHFRIHCHLFLPPTILPGTI